MKGRLKAEARQGDENAFQVLLEIGWATEGDRIDYLGNGVAPEPTLHHYDILPEATDMPEEGGYEELLDADSDDTPAQALKKTVVDYARRKRIPRLVFDKMWDKAMGMGWPEHAEVIRVVRIQIEMYRDETPEHSIRDTSHRSRSSSKSHTFRRRQCRKCKHPYLIIQGNIGEYLEQHTCELCGTEHYSTRSGLTGDFIRLGFLELQQLELDTEKAERKAELDALGDEEYDA